MGKLLVRKKMSKPQLLAYLVNVPPCLIGMESSCSAHHLGRQLREYGHDVRLIPAQFVRPFVKSQKNDHADAEAIAEAVQRPTMRFVPIKTEDQLDIQSIHRAPERLVERRTSLINQLRAFLFERGITVRTGREWLRNEIAELLIRVEQQHSARMSRLLTRMVEEWKHLDIDIEEVDAEIEAIKKGREFATWLGLVPQQRSTGGKTKLLGISKRGNEYLRRLFIHGARSVV